MSQPNPVLGPSAELLFTIGGLIFAPWRLGERFFFQPIALKGDQLIITKGFALEIPGRG
jgi:hypothetical protein